MAVWTSVELNSLSEDFRLDAEHYQPQYLEQDRAMATLPHVELGSIAYVSDGNHLSIAEDFSETGVRYLRGQDLSDFFVSDSEPIYVPQQIYDMLSRSHIFAGDVLVGIVGTIGSIGFVTKRHGKLTGNCKLAIVRARGLPSEYIAAFMSSRVGQNEIRRRVRGAVQMGLVLPDLKTMPIVLPTDIQREAIVNLVREAERSRERSRDLIADAENILADSMGLLHLDLSDSLVYERKFSDLEAAGRFDAEYFSPRYQEALAVLGKDGRCIRSVATLAQRRFRPQTFTGGKTFQYVEISSLHGDGLTRAETLEHIDAPSRAQWIVKENDIITSTVRPIRRLSALITPEQAGYVCSSGFAVLEPKVGKDGIEPEVLLTFLRMPIICEILDLHTTASMYPAISTTRLMEIPIAAPKQSVRDKVVSSVRAAHGSRGEADRLLEEAKTQIEKLVLRGAS
jgi:hypothetical protein